MITVNIYLGISLELFVESSVGSVQFQTVPCSSLYFFSKSIIPFQCLVNINDGVLIHCTCHLQNSSLFFILASSVYKSLHCVISILTQGGKGGHFLGSLVQLCFGEGGTLQTNITGMCVECSQCMDHSGFAPTHGSVLFLGLHCSGSRLLCRGTVQRGSCVSCTSQV